MVIRQGAALPVFIALIRDAWRDDSGAPLEYLRSRGITADMLRKTLDALSDFEDQQIGGKLQVITINQGFDLTAKGAQSLELRLKAAMEEHMFAKGAATPLHRTKGLTLGSVLKDAGSAQPGIGGQYGLHRLLVISLQAPRHKKVRHGSQKPRDTGGQNTGLVKAHELFLYEGKPSDSLTYGLPVRARVAGVLGLLYIFRPKRRGAWPIYLGSLRGQKAE